MTITLELAPDQEEHLAAQASREGLTPVAYLKRLAGLEKSPAAPTAWEALLDSFEEGDEEDQRETLALLQRALEEDRPGQRRVFGSGFNPPRADA